MDRLPRQRIPGSGTTIVLTPDMTVGSLLAKVNAVMAPMKVRDVPPAYRQLERRGRRRSR